MKENLIDSFAKIFKPKNPNPPSCPPKLSELSVLMWNIRGLKSRNRIRTLEAVIRENNVDLAFISETSFFDNENIPFKIDGYSFIAREDKKEGEGRNGGAVILAANEFKNEYKNLPIEYDIPLFQICGIELHNLKFFSFYRSPSTNKDNATKATDYILESLKPNSFFLGDLNIPKTNWEDDLAEHGWQKTFQRKLNKSNHEQLVKMPTRVDPEAILDVLITDRQDLVKEIDIDYAEELSDHKPVLIKIATSKERVEFKYVKDKSKCDWDQVRKDLESVDWDKVNTHKRQHFYRQTESHSSIWNTSERKCVCGARQCRKHLQCKCGRKCEVREEVNELADNIAKVVTAAIDKNTPIVKKRVQSYNTGFVSARTLKQRNKIKKLKQKKLFDELDDAKALLEKYKKDDLDKELLFLETHLKKKKNLYKSMKEVKKGSKTTLGIYKNYPDDKTVTFNQKEKVDILNKYYGSKLKVSKPFDKNWKDYVTDPSEPVINKKTILEAIKKMKGSDSIGPDGLSANDVKQVGEVILDQLEHLYCLCYEYHVMPQIFKTAKVMPIPKPGNPLIPKNQRPINMTSQLYHPMELIIVRFIQLHLELTGYFSPLQHGFRAGKSCTSNLIKWVDSLHHCSQVFCGYLTFFFDYSAAFDVCQFHHVSEMFRKAKVHKNVILLIEEWMTNRTQYVSINNTNSDHIPVLSSVCQGSSVGPVSFICLINELLEELTEAIKDIPGATAHCFADDTKLCLPWFLNDPDEQIKKNQEILDVVSDWSRRRDLDLSETKCKVVAFGHIPKQADYFVTVNGVKHKIVPSTQERDLGIYLTGPNLTFDGQVDNVLDKCLKTIKNSRHIIRRLNFQNMKHLWQMYIKSIACYAGVAWFRVIKKDMDKLNQIYRKFWAMCKLKVPLEETPLTLYQELIVESLMFHHSQSRLLPKERLLPPNPLDPYSDKTFETIPEKTKIPISTPRPKRKYVKMQITPKAQPGRNCKNMALPPPIFDQKSSTENTLHRKIYFNTDLNSRTQNSPRHRLFEIFDSLPVKIKKSSKKDFKWFIVHEILPKLTPSCQDLRLELSNGEIFRKSVRANFYKSFWSNQKNGITLISVEDLQNITQSDQEEVGSLFHLLKKDANLVEQVIRVKNLSRASVKNKASRQ